MKIICDMPACPDQATQRIAGQDPVRARFERVRYYCDKHIEWVRSQADGPITVTPLKFELTSSYSEVVTEVRGIAMGLPGLVSTILLKTAEKILQLGVEHEALAMRLAPLEEHERECIYRHQIDKIKEYVDAEGPMGEYIDPAPLRKIMGASLPKLGE